MLQIDAWKRWLIWLVCAAGVILAVPNAFYTRVETHNDAVANIELRGESPELQAQAAQWPNWLPSDLVNLGLDLRGGAHLLAEVRVSDVYASRMEALWPDVRDALRPERDTVGGIRQQPSEPGILRVRIGNPDGIDRALEVVRGLARPIQSLTGVGANDFEVTADGDTLVIQLSDAEKQASDDRTVRQALEIIRHLPGINLIGMDLMEVAPAYDVGDITALAGASIAAELLCLYAAKSK